MGPTYFRSGHADKDNTFCFKQAALRSSAIQTWITEKGPTRFSARLACCQVFRVFVAVNFRMRCQIQTVF